MTLVTQSQEPLLFRDYRAGPVETVDQRPADGLHERLERVGNTCRNRPADEGFRQGCLVEVGRPILGLHEPARRRYAEEVQVVLEATANEPTLAIEGRSRGDGSSARRGTKLRPRPT